MTQATISPVWTVRAALRWITEKFQSISLETPLLDAQLLLSHAIQSQRVTLYLEPERLLTEAERARLRESVKRRLLGEPVAYILGSAFWHDLELYVDDRVLIPRPETESLLDFVLAITKGTNPKVILDLCTGSGCLAIALARAFPQAEVFAVDISQAALSVAKLNAEKYGCSSITFLEGDVSDRSLYQSLKKPDIITANPPYVSFSEWASLDISVKNYEPKLALCAEEEGLALGRAILQSLSSEGFLETAQVFCMELGLTHPSLLVKEFSLPLKKRESLEFSEFLEPSYPPELLESSVEQTVLKEESLRYRVSDTILSYPQENLFILQDLTNRDRFVAKVGKFSPQERREFLAE